MNVKEYFKSMEDLGLAKDTFLTVRYYTPKGLFKETTHLVPTEKIFMNGDFASRRLPGVSPVLADRYLAEKNAVNSWIGRKTLEIEGKGIEHDIHFS